MARSLLGMKFIGFAIKADQEHIDKLRIPETNAWRVEAKCLDMQRGDSIQDQMMLDNSCKTEPKQMLRRAQSCRVWCKRKGHVVANCRRRLGKCLICGDKYHFVNKCPKNYRKRNETTSERAKGWEATTLDEDYHMQSARNE